MAGTHGMVDITVADTMAGAVIGPVIGMAAGDITIIITTMVVGMEAVTMAAATIGPAHIAIPVVRNLQEDQITEPYPVVVRIIEIPQHELEVRLQLPVVQLRTV